ncbi:DUF3006 domain-containing protein [Methanosarcina sp. MSH10X1]|uniref:DUF3006 domain-containing protein n=1 Tax=Methanosarcina sp. MSH10X1 TaxID=2507075 RepID=UPI000FFBC75A|nr:DUF3006 domain-containing protein [Methanosarcina sp. MSH10X1]RXA20580.1 DUF3006 domain-containing protein [Methanosarcina sp. MSH10X1]
MEKLRESIKVTLDRIEEGIAVLLIRDDESIKINIPLFLLPAESKEGDILDITITRNVQETEEAKERVSSILEKLKNKNQGME